MFNIARIISATPFDSLNCSIDLPASKGWYWNYAGARRADQARFQFAPPILEAGAARRRGRWRCGECAGYCIHEKR